MQDNRHCCPLVYTLQAGGEVLTDACVHGQREPDEREVFHDDGASRSYTDRLLIWGVTCSMAFDVRVRRALL